MAKLSTTQTEPDQSYVVAEDTRLKIVTESTTSTKIATKTVINTTKNDCENSGSDGDANVPTSRIINDPFWGKRPPERMGSGINDGYFVEDNTEVKLNLNTYKTVFVMNKDVLFYKKNSLRKAKQVSLTLKFTRFLNLRWLQTTFFLFLSV